MKKLLFALICLLFICPVMAQDTSLVSGLEDENAVEKITGTFKSTRVINAHSTEMLYRGNMDFRILHRFGPVNSGVKEFFGLDNANMRMSFDFGITNNLMIGIGRSTNLKDLDFLIKTRLFQQTKGAKPIPVSILVAAGYIVTTQQSFATVKPTFSDRSSYYLQMIVGRKFNSNFSMQLSPLLVHNNSTLNPTDDKTIFGLGGGARYKVSKRIALVADYDCPFDEVYFIDPSTISIEDLAPMSFLNEDGSILDRSSTTPTWNATLRYYSNLCISAPNKNSALRDVVQ